MPIESSSKTLRLWAFGDAHVGTDKRNGRDSLVEAITQSESTDGGSPFAWDIAISVHHYVLKDTTVASGGWEGVRQDEQGNKKPGYHGCWTRLQNPGPQRYE